MFDGASNAQIGGKQLKLHYKKCTVMRGFHQTVSLLFNDVSKITMVH